MVCEANERKDKSAQGISIKVTKSQARMKEETQQAQSGAAVTEFGDVECEKGKGKTQLCCLLPHFLPHFDLFESLTD